MKNILVMLFALIFIFIIAIVAIVYNQQRLIIKLGNQIKKADTSEHENAQVIKKTIQAKNIAIATSTLASPFTVKAVERMIIENTKEIKGKLLSKSADSFTIEADVVDFPKLASLKETELSQSDDAFPKYHKNYLIAFNDNTQFLSAKLEHIEIGKTLKIFTNEFIYKADKITASKVIILAEPKTSDTSSLK